MTAEAFLDTNVLIYAVSAAPSERSKQAVARQLIEAGGFGTSVQCLAEFYVNATRKLKQPLSPHHALKFSEGLPDAPIIEVTQPLQLEAIALSVRYQISYRDAAVVAAAIELGVNRLFSEDLRMVRFTKASRL